MKRIIIGSLIAATLLIGLTGSAFANEAKQVVEKSAEGARSVQRQVRLPVPW